MCCLVAAAVTADGLCRMVPLSHMATPATPPKWVVSVTGFAVQPVAATPSIRTGWGRAVRRPAMIASCLVLPALRSIAHEAHPQGWR